MTDAVTPTVHLDVNAGARVHPAAWAAWLDACAQPSAPSALHSGGQAARTLLRRAQSRIAQAIGAAADDICLVSGGTEADALALSTALQPWGPPCAPAPAATRPHIVTTGVEHAAVTKTLDAWKQQQRLDFDVVPAQRRGVIDVAAIAQAIGPQTQLVSMTWACNETGVVQPVAEVAALCRARGVLMHTDAVQAVGRMPVDVARSGVDLLSFSGHKLGAVGNIGVLWVRPGTPAASLYPDAGDDNVPGAWALATALEHQPRADFWADVAAQRDALEARLQQVLGARLEILGQNAERLPNTSCMRFVGCSAEALMMALDVAGFAIATGSACSTGALEPSPLLMGMGLDAQEAQQAIRLSFAAPIGAAAIASLEQALLGAQKKLAGRRF